MYKVFIDGKAGTTGLRIYDRLSQRDDIKLLILNDDERKLPNARKEMINSSDITFLCLPDEAAKESVSLVENDNVKILDTSTAHRTLEDWSYGFPELSDKRRKSIIEGKRVAVPGCHASGFISIVYPLVKLGIIGNDYPLVCYSITGYSGGGRKTIEAYQDADRDNELSCPRQYATAQSHKHLKEMQIIPGLSNAPVFSPIIADYYSGMQVSVPLFSSMLKKSVSPQYIAEALNEYYSSSEIIDVTSNIEQNNYLSSSSYSGKDSMNISVNGNNDRILLISQFDNLGKGASGAAIQCMNLMLGIEETTGLNI